MTSTISSAAAPKHTCSFHSGPCQVCVEKKGPKLTVAEEQLYEWKEIPDHHMACNVYRPTYMLTGRNELADVVLLMEQGRTISKDVLLRVLKSSLANQTRTVMALDDIQRGRTSDVTYKAPSLNSWKRKPGAKTMSLVERPKVVRSRESDDTTPAKRRRSE
jgi:hypothetical protein